ncbi:Uncharacterised protein [Shigella flexneri]|nr:Uncharacterised protein [Shigella flexneri]
MQRQWTVRPPQPEAVQTDVQAPFLPAHTGDFSWRKGQRGRLSEAKFFHPWLLGVARRNGTQLHIHAAHQVQKTVMPGGFLRLSEIVAHTLPRCPALTGQVIILPRCMLCSVICEKVLMETWRAI